MFQSFIYNFVGFNGKSLFYYLEKIEDRDSYTIYWIPIEMKYPFLAPKPFNTFFNSCFESKLVFISDTILLLDKIDKVNGLNSSDEISS